MTVNQQLEITITVRNTRSSPWASDEDYKLALLDDPCGLWDLSLPRVNIPAGVVVPASETFTFTIPLRAPSNPGACTIKVQMIQEFVELFGPTLEVPITIIPVPTAAARNWERYP